MPINDLHIYGIKMNTNPYNKPWKVQYYTHNLHGEQLTLPHDVEAIIDCYGKGVIVTKDGVYGPDAEVAEYIVKCVNESGSK